MWSDFVRLGTPANGQLGVASSQLNAILSFVQRAAMDPAGTYTYINPPPPAYVPPPAAAARKGGKPQARPPPPPKYEEEPRARGDEEEELPQDRHARLRIGSLGALGWIAGGCKDVP